MEEREKEGKKTKSLQLRKSGLRGAMGKVGVINILDTRRGEVGRKTGMRGDLNKRGGAGRVMGMRRDMYRKEGVGRVIGMRRDIKMRGGEIRMKDCQPRKRGNRGGVDYRASISKFVFV